MTTSTYQDLIAAARLVGAKLAFARSALQRHSIWLIAIGYAILAFSWKHSFFADTWWLVYVPVWTVALRQMPSSTDPPLGPVMILSAMVLFAWLFFVTQSAAHEAFQTWEIKSDSLLLPRLSFLIQAILCSLVDAALLATPLRRIVGSRLVAVSVLVGLPYVIVTGHSSLFSIERWSQRTLGNFLLLFYVLMPPLVLAWACQDRNPIPTFLEANLERIIGGAAPASSIARRTQRCRELFWRFYAVARIDVFAMYETENYLRDCLRLLPATRFKRYFSSSHFASLLWAR